MGEYYINGGGKIKGEVRVHGGKNAVLPILAATILNAGISIIHDCPEISDTYYTMDILRSVGCSVNYDDKSKTVTVDSRNADSFDIPEKLAIEMRSSVIFMGGVLGRFKQVNISHPGGCVIGKRSIGFHLDALKKMGATIEIDGCYKCKAEKLHGARINLNLPSVGATENIMLAAVLAEGETIITNAAREPEICDLQNFLNAMGACVFGAGSDIIIIKGVKKLHDVEHRIIPDRIVAGTLLAAAAITGGEIALNNVTPKHISAVTSKFVDIGCQIIEGSDFLCLKAPERLMPIENLMTCPYPGFPTDLQPQFSALMACASGSTTIHETIFESRNTHLHELNRMGANISISQDGRSFFIKGVEKLKGATVEANDLRGGVALILAGIAAEGKTTVLNSGFIERGYEKIYKTLKELGADITFRD